MTGGKVLFAGGTNGHAELATAEVFDVATRTVTATQPMNQPRQRPLAVRFAGGERVLFASGSAEIFDPANGTFQPAEEAGAGEDAVGVLTADGRVRSRKTYRLSSPAQSGRILYLPADGPLSVRHS